MPVPPPTPENAQGPFSEFLNPARRQEIDPTPGPPPAYAGKGTGIAYVAMEFLKGIKSGRLQNMEKQENERLKGLQSLYSHAQQVWADPNASEEDKKLAMNEYSRALGATGLAQMGGSGKGKGKKSADEYPSKDGQVVGDGSSPLGVDPKKHFTNIMKDVFTGMVGGKAPPKGDVNFTESIGRITSSMNERKQQYDQLAAQATQQLQQMSGRNQTEVQHAMMPIFQQMAKLRPKDAAEFQQQALSGFVQAPDVPKQPAPGSAEERIMHERRAFQDKAYSNLESTMPVLAAGVRPDQLPMGPPSEFEKNHYGRTVKPPESWIARNNTNPTDVLNLTKDEQGNYFFANTNIPVPPEQLKQYALERPGMGHRPEVKRLYTTQVNGVNYEAIQQLDGSIKLERSGKKEWSPNTWMSRVNVMDERDRRKSAADLEKEYLRQKKSTISEFSRAKAKMLTDPLMQGNPNVEKITKSLDAEQEARLEELKADFESAKQAVSTKPEGKGRTTPEPPPSAPAPKKEVDAWITNNR